MPIGGGGLISGVAAYVKRLRPETKIIGVKAVDGLIQKAAVADIDLAGGIGAGIIEFLKVQPVRGDLDNAVAPFGHQLPELVQIGDATGQTASHADNCKRLVMVVIRAGSILPVAPGTIDISHIKPTKFMYSQAVRNS